MEQNLFLNPNFEKNAAFLFKGKRYPFSHACLRIFSPTYDKLPYIPMEIGLDLPVSEKSFSIFVDAINMWHTKYTYEDVSELLFIAIKFDVPQLRVAIIRYISTSVYSESITIECLKFNAKNGLDTDFLEEEIVKSIDRYLTLPAFLDIPDQIISRIISRTKIDSNKIFTLVTDLHSKNRSVFTLFPLIDCSELSIESQKKLENIVFPVLEENFQVPKNFYSGYKNRQLDEENDNARHTREEDLMQVIPNILEEELEIDESVELAKNEEQKFVRLLNACQNGDSDLVNDILSTYLFQSNNLYVIVHYQIVEFLSMLL